MTTIQPIGTGTAVFDTTEGKKQYKTLKLSAQVTDDSPIEFNYDGQRYFKQKIKQNGKEEIMYVCIDEDPKKLEESEASKYTTEKTCEDGKDDGKISWTEKLWSMGKGIIKPFKSMFNFSSTKETWKSIGKIGLAIGLAAVSIIFPPVGTALLAAGAVMGAATIGVGAYQSYNAKTDAEEKNAWENIGNGTFTLITSLIGLKGMRNAASAKAAAIKDAKTIKLGAADNFAPQAPGPTQGIQINTAKPSLLARTKGVVTDKAQSVVNAGKEAYHVGKDVVTLGKETRTTLAGIKEATKAMKLAETQGINFTLPPKAVDTTFLNTIKNLEIAVRQGDLVGMQKRISVLDSLVSHVSSNVELSKSQLATIEKAHSLLNAIKVSHTPVKAIGAASLAQTGSTLNPFETPETKKQQAYEFVML